MNQGLYKDDAGTRGSGIGSVSIFKTLQQPVLTFLAAGATAAVLSGAGFMDAATAFNGGLGATVGIIAAQRLIPQYPLASWIVPIAVPALVGMKIDGTIVGTGLVATMVYTQKMVY